MNILNKTCKAFAPIPGNSGPGVSKMEKYSWETPGPPGEFQWIAKELLNIEGAYQRDEESDEKVMRVARAWDWKLFNTVSVARRPDGTLWAFDAGHRVRAAFLRDDIKLLPCMIHDVEDIKDEAKAFVGTNTMVSNVSAYHKHRASVVAGEPISLRVQKILDKHGYKPSTTAKQKWNFAAIHTLHAKVKQNEELAARVFEACAKIAADGGAISGNVICAIYCCQLWVQGREDILAGVHLDRLMKEGISGIERALRDRKNKEGIGGEAVEARGLLDLLNKGKRRRLTFA